MLEGSSALQYEATRQIVTPKIKVTMQENDYLYHVGRTQLRFNNFSQILSWNDYLIGTGGSGIITTTKDGISLVASTSILTGNVSNVVNNGGTLIAFLNNGATFYRIFSTNATTWGSTEIIRGGAGASIKTNLLATNDSHLYYFDRIGQTSSTFTMFEDIIRCLKYDGASWMLSTVYNKRFWNMFNTSAGDVLYDNEMTGGRVEGTDYDVIYFTSADSVEEARFKSDIRKIKSDGINTFDDELFLAKGNTRSGYNLGNIGKGASYYYLPFYRTYNIDIVKNGITFNTLYSSNMYIIKSKDLENWSTPIDTGIPAYRISYFAVATDETNYYRYKILGTANTAGGASLLTYIEVHGGNTTVDLSDNLIFYSNQSNQRVNLTIGNYK